MKKIFLICPVRNATEKQREIIADYIAYREKTGYVVHYPARDTDQDDPIGYRICQDNRKAIEAADEVHVFWDDKSTGTLFDLGMAFSLKKRLVIVNNDDLVFTNGKSFANMISRWEVETIPTPDWF